MMAIAGVRAGARARMWDAAATARVYWSVMIVPGRDWVCRSRLAVDGQKLNAGDADRSADKNRYVVRAGGIGIDSRRG